MSQHVQIVALIPKRTKIDKKRHNNKKCHTSHVTCHVLRVTATATNPPPANSPTIHSRLVHKNKKPRKNFKIKNCDGRPILAIRPFTRGLQFTGEVGFSRWHRQIYRQTDRHFG